MSGEVLLSEVTQGDYQRYLSGQAAIMNHPQLRKLGSPDPLPWADAERMLDGQVSTQVDESLRPYVEAVLSAKAIEGLLENWEMNAAQSSAFISSVSSLIQLVPGLSLDSEIRQFASLLSLSTLQATTWEEFVKFYRAVQCIRDRFPGIDVEFLTDTIKVRFFSKLSEGAADTSFAAIVEKLKALRDLQDLGVNLSMFPAYNIVVSVALCHVPLATVSDPEKGDIIRLLAKLQPQSPAVKSLAEEFNIELNQQQDQPDDPSDPQRPTLPPGKGCITSSSQLKISSHPISANPHRDPQIYVYDAIFELEGTEINGIVKQFISADKSKLKKADKNEGRILAHLSDKGQYFLKYYGSYLEPLADGRTCYAVIMERCQKSLMKDFTDRMNAKAYYTESELIFLSRSLIEAFSIMAAHRIYHYDVKPHNILVSDDGNLKICDFNISNMLETTTFTTIATGTVEIQGTEGYMAPEVQSAYNRRKAGQDISSLQARPGRIDCYGVGLVLLQAATLKTVVGMNTEQNQDLLEKAIRSVEFPWFRNILWAMLKFDFRERRSIKTLFKDMQSSNRTA